jgi:NAD(P)H-dependent FMN reductase
VSPEYKNGIPGALKNALDYLRPQIFKRTPLAIATVSSGGFGGINCLSQLRLVGLALGGIPISEKLCVSNVDEVFDINGMVIEDSISEQTTQFAEAFLWYIK